MITINESSVTLDYSDLPEADRTVALMLFKDLTTVNQSAIMLMRMHAASAALDAKDSEISGACAMAAMVLAAALWNPRTLKALKASIEHWERLSTDNRMPGESMGSSDCALCDVFFHNDCEGCPIKEATGQLLCRGTPYYETYAVFRKFGIDSPEFRAAAAAELAFLKSLLPKEEA